MSDQENRRSLCTLCGVVDAIEVTPSGRVRPGSKWGLCPKGAAFLEVNGKDRTDRIQYPYIKEKGKWQQATWDEALNLVATRLLQTKAKRGGEGIAYYGNGQQTMESLWLLQKTFKGYLGINNLAANSEQCVASSCGAHELVFGNEGSFGSYDDFLEADAILLYGANPALNHPTLFNNGIQRNKNAVKVVIDPRRSDTVKKLTRMHPDVRHIQIRSGGDALLNLSIAHVLISRGQLDQAYIDEYIDPESWTQFRDYVLGTQFAPEEAAQVLAPANVSAEVFCDWIYGLAELWATRKIASMSSVGINQTTGSQGVATILNLHLITGAIGEPGRGHVRVSGQSNAPSELGMGFNCSLLPFRLKVADPEHRRMMETMWNLPPGSIRGTPGLPMVAFSGEKAPDFFFLMGNDFTRNMPSLTKWRSTLEKAFVVVADSYLPDDAWNLVDVVLPARTHAEVSGVYMNGERRLQILEPLLDPPPEARGDTTIIVDLARVIASRAPVPAPFETIFPYPRDEQGEIISEVVYNEILECSKGMYNEFTDGEGRPITYERMRWEGGVQWAGDRRYHKNGSLFPGLFKKGPHHRAKLVVPDSEILYLYASPGDFKLVTGRGTQEDNLFPIYLATFNSGLKARPSTLPEQNFLYMHPDDFMKLGMQPGEWVEISNHLGAVSVQTKESDEVAPGYPFMTFQLSKNRLDINVVTDISRFDKQTKQPRIKFTPVSIVPIGKESLNEIPDELKTALQHAAPAMQPKGCSNKNNES